MNPQNPARRAGITCRKYDSIRTVTQKAEGKPSEDRLCQCTLPKSRRGGRENKTAPPVACPTREEVTDLGRSLWHRPLPWYRGGGNRAGLRS